MITNTILIRWLGGFVERRSASSITTYGRREGVLSVGDVADAVVAFRMADDNFRLTDSPLESLTASMDDVDPADGWSAYTAYVVGDSMTVPTLAGGTTTNRVASISVSEDENGYLSVQTEFKSLRDVLQQRVQRWLSRTNNGTLAGRSANSAPVSVSSPSVSSETAQPESVPFGTTGSSAATVGDTTNNAVCKVPGLFYRVDMTATAAGSGSTSCDIKVDGTTVCSVTLGSGQVAATYDLTASQTKLVTRNSLFSAVVTAVSGATGFSINCLVASTAV